ncbi:hypothetical protein P9112_007885 [Eukaryota sp. TZLM1-RC]
MCPYLCSSVNTSHQLYRLMGSMETIEQMVNEKVLSSDQGNPTIVSSLREASRLADRSFSSSADLREYLNNLGFFNKIKGLLNVMTFLQVIASFFFVFAFVRVFYSHIIRPFYRFLTDLFYLFNLDFVIKRLWILISIYTIKIYSHYPKCTYLIVQLIVGFPSIWLTQIQSSQLNFLLSLLLNITQQCIASGLYQSPRWFNFGVTTVFSVYSTLRCHSVAFGVLSCLSLVSALGFVVAAFGMGYALGFNSDTTALNSLISSGFVLFSRIGVHFLMNRFSSGLADSIHLFDAGIFHVVNFVFCLASFIYTVEKKIPYKYSYIIGVYSLLVLSGIKLSISPIYVYASVFLVLFCVEEVLVLLRFSALSVCVSSALVILSCYLGKVYFEKVSI